MEPVKKPEPVKPLPTTPKIMTPATLLELSQKQKEQAKAYVDGARKYFPT